MLKWTGTKSAALECLRCISCLPGLSCWIKSIAGVSSVSICHANYKITTWIFKGTSVWLCNCGHSFKQVLISLTLIKGMSPLLIRASSGSRPETCAHLGPLQLTWRLSSATSPQCFCFLNTTFFHGFGDCQYYKACAEMKVVDDNHKFWEKQVLSFLLKLIRNVLTESDQIN